MKQQVFVNALKRISQDILVIVIFFSLPLHLRAAQEEDMAYVNTSTWKWQENSTLRFDSNSAKHLEVWNKNAKTAENRRNRTWSSGTAWMSIPYDGSRPHIITFSIKNTHSEYNKKYAVYNASGQQEWHDGNIYWGIELNVRNRQGERFTYSKHYCNGKTKNRNYTYTDTNDTDSETWRPCKDIEKREIVIVVDERKVEVYDVYESDKPFKTFYNANGVEWVGIKVGNAANIIVENFNILRQTDYGAAKPKIAEAAQALVNHNYSAAASIATNIIDKIYKSAEVYMLRAGAYAGMEYYKSAIEDYTNAINFSYNDNDEEAYYMRGLCKFRLEDYSCVDDFRRGGHQGRVFLNEHEWLTKPKPKPQPQKPQLQKQGSGGSAPTGGGSKGALTKDPNFQKK